VTHRNIIVIGASAGGFEALTHVIAALPKNLAAAVFVVLHIPTHSPTNLHSILDRAGPLRAVEVTDGEAVEEGRIYVGATDRHLMVEAGKVRLPRGPRENRFRPAIDVLFRSAAQEYGPRVIGVVLGGLLDDGTAGLWSIKDRAGTTVVQSEQEARDPDMIRSAKKFVQIDHELPVADIAALLVRLTSEQVEPGEVKAPAHGLTLEVKTALEGNALKRGVMKLGEISGNTCPECHGVLVKIREDRILRFRCHTGHAYSLETLLADVGEEIDKTLWGAVRAIEERAILLREMEQGARADGETQTAERLAGLAVDAEKRAQHVRSAVVDHDNVLDVGDGSAQS
jgi:two-component system chemotaxis response regulator CheB